jgi:hypothetical protein
MKLKYETASERHRLPIAKVQRLGFLIEKVYFRIVTVPFLYSFYLLLMLFCLPFIIYLTTAA